MKSRLPLILATAAATLVALALPASAAHEGSRYDATLGELNGSGASGTASLTVSDDGETMTVTVQADGLNLDGPHALHFHGIVEGEDVLASACPTMADDTNGDGVLTVAEGAPKYGGVQVSLTTEGDTSPDSALAIERFPAGTSVDYMRAEIPIPEVLRPSLGNLHVVVHGIDENGNGTLDLEQEERSSLTDDLPREGTAPALCGTLSAVASGPVQTGAGGTADSDSSSTTALAIAGTGIAVLAVGGAVRRRVTVEA